MSHSREAFSTTVRYHGNYASKYEVRSDGEAATIKQAVYVTVKVPGEDAAWTLEYLE